ncbi:hypothetical protein CUN61_27625 [Pseudomonas arsenicoxydans]|uniref:Uncharacterized protein n=1 Tax=Pseudomonas arsenicoxydans TaxID=702115 RepID=A0A4P6GAI0_9PSED|nr:hypothetical protein CUN61_27625 [Pseudomonas arsenicoxydans]
MLLLPLLWLWAMTEDETTSRPSWPYSCVPLRGVFIQTSGAPIANRLAPTGDLYCSQIQCGSEPARDGVGGVNAKPTVLAPTVQAPDR